MKKLLLLFFFGCSLLVQSQSEQLAQNYFDRGEFEKALISYQELLKIQPGNSNYFDKTIECHQQLLQFEIAEKALNERLAKYKQGAVLVHLGFNFQLQKNQPKAQKFYEEAINRIQISPNEVYAIAYIFEKKGLVDYALQSYQVAIEKDQNLNFNFQMALLYGQKGDIEMMIEKFLIEAYNNPQNNIMIQNQLSRFMNEEGEATFNESLKKKLLLRTQKSQDLFWNEYLSWFYVQIKEYGKAFVQEKAIYKRNPESFGNIVNLAQLAIEENQEDEAKEILQFVLNNTQDLDLQIESYSYLMEMKIKKAQVKEYPAIDKELDDLIQKFGVSPFTLSLLKIKAHFATFYLNQAELGKMILKNALEMPLNRYQIADIKMELADVMLFEEKFNQALLYYSQIEDDMKNDVIGQEASFKTARTSYFKNDFKWATHQLKILKSAATQLIANDALDLFLLISDATVEDSTQVALKKFARADFFLYQGKKAAALEHFQAILKIKTGDPIEPVTHLRIGKILEQQNDFIAALSNYKVILTDYKDCIYIDEALFYSAEIYNQLKDPEKAKPLYEEIITKHPDSIYYVMAQKKYRQLRGDKDI